MKERKQKNMQNTDAVAWTKKLVGIESTNPGKEEYEIAGFLEQEIRAALPERGELKKDYTIVMVTHNMQQATRVSDTTAFFLLGDMIEADDTEKLFSTPRDKRTEDYITGRFG